MARKIPPLSLEILDHLPPIPVEIAPGFQYDEAGVRTRNHYRGGDPMAPGVMKPTPRDSWEWAPLVWSVLRAKGSYTMVELGAGWGPWAVRAYSLARHHGLHPRRVIAVEAEPNHFDYLRQHMDDNAVPDDDRVLVQAMVAARSGIALFPVTETPELSWGLRKLGREGTDRDTVLAESGATPLPDEPGLYQVPKSPHRYRLEQSISFADLIGDTARIDFLHADIQGSEGEVLPDAIALLDERVRLIAIGTHSHAIEDSLRALFTEHNWHLHHDTAMHQRADGRWADGHQLWQNPRV